MALTKISRSLLDTGVSDSSDATAITIDSSENVGIANTSPVSKLDVTHTITSNTGDSIASFGTSGSGGWANSAHQVIVGGPSLSTYTGLIISSDSTSGNGQISFADGKGASDSWRGYIGYNHASDFMTFGTNANEVMRIDSSGNVGIGTSSPNSYANYTVLTIDSPSSGTGSVIDLEYRTDRSLSMFSEGSLSTIREIRNYPLAFGTNNTERMRINSSGNTMFGTTSEAYSSARLHVGNGNATYAYAFGTIANYSPFYILNSAGTGVRLDNNSTSWTSSSDETLKENIEDIGNVLDIVKNYRTVKFNFIGQEEEKIGFIAQDWENDFPQVISVDERDNKLGIQYTETIPVLLKAIQEQQEQIESLQQEIEVLKNGN